MAGIRMPLIEVKDVSYSYRGRTALSCVDLSIEAGSFVAVLGSNGAGKSTLARILNATLLPTGGEVLVDGLSSSDIANSFGIRKTVGLVLQNPDNQIIGDTVEDDVAFALENMGMLPNWIDSIVTDVLKYTGLSDLRFSDPHRLSGGQKQLLAIAGVLAMKPKCVVLDESLSMLDPKSRRSILSLLHRLNRENGLTIVMMTQDVSDAMDCDRVIILESGRIAASGAPGEVGLDDGFVSSLVSALKENGFPVRDGVVSEDDLIAVLTGGRERP